MKITWLLITLYVAFAVASFVHLQRLRQDSERLAYGIETTRQIVRGDMAGGVTRTLQMLDATDRVRVQQSEQAKWYIYLAVALTLPVAMGLAREFEKRKAT